MGVFVAAAAHEMNGSAFVWTFLSLMTKSLTVTTVTVEKRITLTVWGAFWTILIYLSVIFTMC